MNARDKSQKDPQTDQSDRRPSSGIQQMIEGDRYCVDILNQISAVRSALDALGVELLMSHVQTCVIGRHTQHPKAKPLKPAEILEELHHVLSRFLK